MTDPVTAIQSATEVVGELSALVDALKILAANIALGAASLISACAVIAKYMPPPNRPGILSRLHGIINAAGQNSGYAANASKDGD